MKIQLVLFMSLSVVLSAEPLTELKLLSIGNSYTVNAHSLLRKIIENHGKAKAVIGMAQIGGCTFERHWKEHLKSEEKPEHKPYKYNGKPMNLRDYLTVEKWDVVTIQSQSLQASQPETWQPYLDNILGLVKELAPQAKIVLYRTWAYRQDHHLFKKGDEFTAEKMNEKIGQAFAELSKKLNAPILPAGDAIWAAYQEEPVKLVVPDPNFDYKNPVHPNLPNQEGSLHNGHGWHKDKKTDEWKFSCDASHLNVRGRYLVGCLFYAYLFQQDISDLKWAPRGIKAEDAAFLRGIAQKFAKPQIVNHE
ncbi:MAG: DUF4886 domain-containing protein [Lentisphaeria bacterium]|nr:DUF4886 domain-containing protein [Lentisphaeria bacterium]